VGAALLAGILASAGLALLTSVLAFWGPHGHSYFLGGNSALQFPSELAPAFISAGWTTLALDSRSHPHPVVLGAAVWLIGAELLIAYWAVAILTGVDLGLALVLGGLFEVAAPILALTLPLRARARRTLVGPGWSLIAAIVLLIAIAVPTVGLQACGPALGLPEAPRQFRLCIPFSS
jgi:hypothetical protein